MNGKLLTNILIGLAIALLIAIVTAPWLLGTWTIVRELFLR